MKNLNGLDLELSQTKRHFERCFKPKESKGSPEKAKRLINKGDLIDSLDLNIGYESIQKLKDNWGQAFSKKSKQQAPQ